MAFAPVSPAQGVEPVVIAGGDEEATDETRGDGGPAVDGRFSTVDGLDWAGDGSILIADRMDGRIRIIDPDGKIHTNSDGLSDPSAVFSAGWDPDDFTFKHSFIAADEGDDQVESWQLTSLGGFNDVAAMEDVDATDVEDASDGFWVADPLEGTVWHVRFNPMTFPGWQHAPALENLDSPWGIGPLPGGGFLVATDGSDCAIRRHTSGGTKVVAGKPGFCLGTPQSGPHGNGGPATDALLHHPTDVEATPDGGFVFAERHWLRRVEPDGTLSTVYQTGLFVSNDFPPPFITALEVTPDGDVLLGLNSRRVLRFDTNYAGAGPGGGGPGGGGPGGGGPGGGGPVGGTIGAIHGKGALSGVVVKALCQASNGCMLGASGVVRIPKAALASKAFALKRAKPRLVAGGQTASLKLKLPRQTKRAVARALSKKRFRKRVKATITVTDTAPATPTSSKKKIRFSAPKR
jgi:hypothetical protein